MDKKRILTQNFWGQMLLNSAIMLIGAIAFPIGAGFSILVLPLWHINLTIFNVKKAVDIKQLSVLQLIMLLCTELGILFNSLLYFTVICYDYDGVYLVKIEAVSAAVVVTILSIVGLTVRWFMSQRRSPN